MFLSQNNKLDAEQSGFRSGHSTETALLSITEALRIEKANSKSSVLILLDLSAAFDTVNHQILLSTLSSMDITGIPLRWFESYLTGRSFRVAWGGEVSKAHQLVTGVPQGSVLGPLLFSTYTTSLGPIIQAHGFSYHFYADDKQLYLSFPPDDPTVAARISGCLADISDSFKTCRELCKINIHTRHKTMDQHRTTDTRRLHRETNKGNEGDTGGATEKMIW